ncbi:MAG: PQQ-binding-like beta-propeller repeat protein [Kosmotogaceae bacterium]
MKGKLILVLLLSLISISILALDLKINTVTAVPFITGPNGRVFLRCEAVGEGILGYKWEPAEGEIIRDYKDGTAVWQAPDELGFFNISVIVNTKGGKLEGEVVVKVDEIANRPPEIQLLYPEDGSSNVPKNPTLIWYAKDEDSDYLYYDIFISTTMSFTEPLIADYDSLTYSPQLKGNRQYYWKVIVDDGRGLKAESPVWSFKTINTRPVVNIPSQAVAEGSKLKIDLLDYSYDPDDDPLSFELIKGPGEITNSFYLYQPGYEDAGEYEVGIAVSDDDKITKEYFALKVINTNRPPNKPIPIGDYTEIPTDTVVRWTCSDPDNDELTYDVYFGSKPETIEKVVSDLEITELRLPLAPHSNYYWKIVAKDTYGAVTKSDLLELSTMNNPPMLKVPPQGINEGETLRLDLEEYSSDKDGDPVSYELVSGPGKLVNSEFVFEPDYDSQGTHVIVVIVSDGIDSNEFDFEVIVEDVNRSPSVELLDPEDKAKDVALDYTLKWNSKDPDNDDMYYSLYISEGKLPDSPFAVVGNEEFEGSFKPHTTYFWKVSVNDIRDKGDALTSESQTWSFSTLNRPVILKPACFSVKEGQELFIDLRDYTHEEDGDEITYEILDAPASCSLVGHELTYRPDYEAAGQYNIIIKASDGYGSEDVQSYQVTVIDVNRAPVKPFNPQTNYINDGIPIKVEFSWESSDPDGDELIYDFVAHSSKGREIREEDLRENKIVLVLQPHTVYRWQVIVKDIREDSKSIAVKGPEWEFETLNHAPIQYRDFDIKKIHETESLEFNLNKYFADIDGDSISFELKSGPGKITDDELYVFETGYEDAGMYTAVFKVSDGIDSITSDYTFEVIDKNRSPQVELIYPKDGEHGLTNVVELQWKGFDADGDKLVYDVYVTDDEEELILKTTTKKTTYLLEDLEYGENYYWKVIAKDDFGGVSEEKINVFTPTILNQEDILWKIPHDGLIFSSAAYGEPGIVYAANNTLFARNHLTGELIWSFKAENKIYSTPAIYDHGTIYFGDNDGKFYAVTSQGDLKWSVQLKGKIEASPAVSANKTIFVGTGDGIFYAIARNGNILWTKSLGVEIKSTAAVDKAGNVYVGAKDRLHALSQDGELLWTFKTQARVESSPAISDNGIIFGSNDGNLYNVNQNGKLVWKFDTGEAIKGGAAIGPEGNIYFGSYSWEFFALKDNGKLLWKYETKGPVHSIPALAKDGSVVFGSLDGTLYSLKVNGSLKWRFNSENWFWASPLITENGNIYIGSHDRTMYAIKDTNGGPVEEYWPMFKYDMARTSSLQEEIFTDELEDLFDGYLIATDNEVMYNYEAVKNDKELSISVINGYLVWEVPAVELLESRRRIEPYIPDVELGDCTFRFVLDENGKLYYGTTSREKEDLLTLVVPANNNYMDLEGQILRSVNFKDSVTLTDPRTTLFSALAFEEHKKLIKKGYCTANIMSYTTIFNGGMLVDNISGENLSIARTWLVYVDTQMNRISAEWKPVYESWNEVSKLDIYDGTERIIETSYKWYGVDDVITLTGLLSDNIDQAKAYIEGEEMLTGIRSSEEYEYDFVKKPSTATLTDYFDWLINRHFISVLAVGGRIEVENEYNPEVILIIPGINSFK